MSKTALFFPGQASQYVGMGKDLYEHSADVRRLYEFAADQLSADIAHLSFEGPAEELKKTKFTQPAIMLHSLAVLTVLQNELPQFHFAAGHSLGEYAALAAAGVLRFTDAIAAVVRRAALMEEACVKNPGTMAAIMGLDDAALEKVCADASDAGTVVPANYNSNNQTVISGHIAAVQKACELAKAAGAKRAIMLEVGGAFHSPLMASARDGLQAYLADMVILPSRQKVVANVTAQPAATGDEIKKLLVEQVTAPVRWAQTMSYLAGQGVTRVIEVGPGKVLTGMAKREMQLEQTLNLDTLNDIKAISTVSA
ncbi:MAG: ACP S-malonyltransferase [bacterium]|nr:ACP S-malonyltransferase [bacterium]